MKKRVLLITQYFYPENFKSNDIAFELVKRGYEVDALVGIPNYPEGKYYQGYGLFKKRHEIVNGVHVYRAFQTPRGKGGWRLPINYFSYVISASLWVVFKFAWKKRYDCVIVHEPSPIFQALPAILYKKLRKVPVYIWVLDIWPEAIVSSGGIKNKKVYNAVKKIVSFVYRNCDKILISSRRFKEMIVDKGNFDSKIVYFPNWSEDILSMDQNFDIPALPDGFRIMIAGNLGKVQNLDAVGDAMVALRDTDVKWLIVGDGSKKAWLDSFIEENGLQNVAITYGKYPFKAMPAFYKQADALLVTLESGYRQLEAVVPARLQSYMSAGVPILAMIGQGTRELIEEADNGYAVPAGDSKALAQLIREKVLPDKEAFRKKGANGRVYYEKYFTLDKCITDLENIIKNQSV